MDTTTNDLEKKNHWTVSAILNQKLLQYLFISRYQS